MATSEDVARLAGVSRATVSRVMSGTARVSEATRRRVEAAAASLGYEPDVAAQSLSGARSKTIALGFFANDMWALSQMIRPQYHFHLDVLRHIEEAAAKAGYDLLMPSRPASASSDSYVRLLRSRRVAGTIMVACPPGDVRTQALIESRLPTVFIDTIGVGPSATYVTSDNTDGARQITEHLLQLGHRRIARITGTETDPSGHDRLAGIRQALAAHGVAEDTGLARKSDWSVEGAYREMLELLDRRGDFTAVIAESDMMAIGILRALHEHGLRVAEDVSLTGFDDIDLSAFASPPLTTVRQDAEAMGVGAVHALLDLVDGRSVAPLVLPTEIVIRSSTAAPRG
ncbi:LacI family transcriptional regulator [Streptomyces sp. WAC 06738]|uniref:LacI family DNA-binding transcriptional regulator n=1 Tax=Streptomyces sp. WAC 06738 TaxID=2203210 RepID=UPI000F6FAADD|nr:LacI family DNA-binding transcriptional regulator [Streptomyces sp. WAC 06738]AZM48731.1 LacI family transcriptional regulator [Streptomyces sp. WAC 06738]